MVKNKIFKSLVGLFWGILLNNTYASCSAPSLSISLGNVDFYQASNFPLSTYRKLVDVIVSCDTPDQAWQILPYLRTLQINEGSPTSTTTNSTSKNVYVSFTNISGQVPGALFNNSSGLSGVGTQTVVAQLVFGEQIPSGAVADSNNYLMSTGGVPYGPIELRGGITLDIPLVIYY